MPIESQNITQTGGDLQNLQNLYHISSNAAIVEIGDQAVGFIQKLSVSEDSGNTQIFEVGSPVATDITTGKLSVKVSGSIILSNNPILYDGGFLPKNPFEITAQSMAGIAFNILISNRVLNGMKLGNANKGRKSKGFVPLTAWLKGNTFGFAKIENCRCSKISTSVDSSKQIGNDFEAVGQILQRSQTTKKKEQDVEGADGYNPDKWWKNFWDLE